LKLQRKSWVKKDPGKAAQFKPKLPTRSSDARAGPDAVVPSVYFAVTCQGSTLI
jgi:hypothetical protein